MTQSRKRILIGACVLAGLIAIWIGWRVYVFTAGSTLQVVPTTTVVNGPMRSDGSLDFEAALHQQASAGVTPENNMAVLLANTLGPGEVPGELRERYYQYLGIPELPERGDYFVSQETFAQQITDSPTPHGEKYFALLDEMSVAQERPWTRNEHPRVLAWIEVNQEHLKLIDQASLRSHFYLPMVSAEGLLAAPLPLLQDLRVVVRLLVSRAMLRIAEGELDGAASDLLICHRLAALVGRNSPVIGNLVAIAMDSMATTSDQVLLAQPLTAEQIQRFQKEILAQPNITEMAATIDQYERLTALDAMQALWRGTSALSENKQFLRLSKVDINIALRRFNAYFDTLLTAMRTEGVQNRLRAIESLDAEQKAQTKELFTFKKVATRLLWSSRKEVHESIADVFLRFVSTPSVHVQIAEDRARMRRELLRLGLALALYRAKH